MLGRICCQNKHNDPTFLVGRGREVQREEQETEMNGGGKTQYSGGSREGHKSVGTCELENTHTCKWVSAYTVRTVCVCMFRSADKSYMCTQEHVNRVCTQKNMCVTCVHAQRNM